AEIFFSTQRHQRLLVRHSSDGGIVHNCQIAPRILGGLDGLGTVRTANRSTYSITVLMVTSSNRPRLLNFPPCREVTKQVVEAQFGGAWSSAFLRMSKYFVAFTLDMLRFQARCSSMDRTGSS